MATLRASVYLITRLQPLQAIDRYRTTTFGPAQSDPLEVCAFPGVQEKICLSGMQQAAEEQQRVAESIHNSGLPF